MLLKYVTVEEFHNTKLSWLKANQHELEDQKEFQNIESFLHL